MLPNSLLAVLLGLVLGCGGASVTPVTDATYTDGLRYYAPMPYLLATSQGQSIVWLPNPQESYVIKQKWGIGVNTLQVTLANGWQLSSVGATSDTKIPEMIQAVGAVAGSAGKFLLVKPGEPAQPVPAGLYPLEFKPGPTGHWEIKQ